MRISDWSSDVCSSDLAWIGWRALRGLPGARRPHFVTTVHGLNSPSRYSAVMTRGERVICVSETVRDYVLQHYPRPDPTKLRVVPRGIDPAAFPFAPWPARVAPAGVAVPHPRLGGAGPLPLSSYDRRGGKECVRK